MGSYFLSGSPITKRKSVRTNRKLLPIRVTHHLTRIRQEWKAIFYRGHPSRNENQAEMESYFLSGSPITKRESGRNGKLLPIRVTHHETRIGQDEWKVTSYQGHPSRNENQAGWMESYFLPGSPITKRESDRMNGKLLSIRVTNHLTRIRQEWKATFYQGHPSQNENRSGRMESYFLSGSPTT